MIRRTLALLFVFAVTGVGTVSVALNKTAYRPQEDCSLCGGKSILSLYNDVNGIGVLNFNDFTVYTLRICNEEPNMSGSPSTINSSGESGSVVSIDSNIDRRIAEVEISLRENSKPNHKEMAEFLCVDCCKRIEDENQYDIGFIDYQIREIHPIQENSIEFYMGDYAIHKIKADEESLEYLVFYAPLR